MKPARHAPDYNRGATRAPQTEIYKSNPRGIGYPPSSFSLPLPFTSLRRSPHRSPHHSTTPTYQNHLRHIQYPTHTLHIPHTSQDLRPRIPRQTMPSPGFQSPSSSQYSGIGVHQGAVDPSTVTSAPPTEVMKHVLGVLQGMGVAITEESKFRLRCVRPLRRDSGASDMTSSSEESVNSVSFLLLRQPIRCPAGGTLFTGRMVLCHQGSSAPSPIPLFSFWGAVGVVM